MEKYNVDFATIYQRWEKTFEAKNMFDALHQAKRYALHFSDLTETKVYFSFKNGDTLYCSTELKENETMCQFTKKSS